MQVWQRQSGKILPSEPLAALVERALDRLQLAGQRVELTLVSDDEMRALNRRFLGRDYPTNVLSFAAGEPGEVGEIVVNVDHAAREAEESRNPLLYLVGFYAIHGLLHLAGFDHEGAGEQAAAIMESQQEQMGDLLNDLARPGDDDER